MIFFTNANAAWSHTEGLKTFTKQRYAHAEGQYATGSGIASHAEGDSTLTLGEASHAEGHLTTASGHHSHTEGTGSYALAPYSHAEGELTRIESTGSHAEGSGSIVGRQAPHSHAEGIGNSISVVKAITIIEKMDFYCFSFTDFLDIGSKKEILNNPQLVTKYHTFRYQDIPSLCIKYKIKKNLIKPLFWS